MLSAQWLTFLQSIYFADTRVICRSMVSYQNDIYFGIVDIDYKKLRHKWRQGNHPTTKLPRSSLLQYHPKSPKARSLINLPHLTLGPHQYPRAKVWADWQILANPEDFLYESRATETGGGDLARNTVLSHFSRICPAVLQSRLKTEKIMFLKLVTKMGVFVSLCQLSLWHFLLGFFLLSFFVILIIVWSA